MLSKQAEMSMLNGDFEHFDESGAELLAGKEVAAVFLFRECITVQGLVSDGARPCRLGNDGW